MRESAMRHSVVLVGALATALMLLVVMLAIPPEKADAARKFRVVTKTFHKSSTITIPAGAPTNVEAGPASPYPSTVRASKLRRGTIKDVNVTLRNLTHTFPDDVNVLLVGPRGQNALIMSDVGFHFAVNNITLRLDDEAADSLSDQTQLISGTFKPTNVNGPSDAPDVFPGGPAPSGAVALSRFNRTNPNGTWRLYVYDDASGDVGEFAGGWSLQIKARVLIRR